MGGRRHVGWGETAQATPYETLIGNIQAALAYVR